MKRGARDATYCNGDEYKRRKRKRVGRKDDLPTFSILFILFNSPVGGVEHTEGCRAHTATREGDIYCVYTGIRGRGAVFTI
jgi:hypothetical protein